MNLFDTHIHLESGTCSREKLLARFREAGVGGGVIISQPPSEAVLPGGVCFEERLENVLTLTEGCETLYPALWLHPLEPDACGKAERAALAGIAAFKIICDRFYPDDPACLRLVRAMAQTDRPVIFHSGILWDGGVSSRYNRPVGFEALIEVPHLRFSLAHCGWPWHDECLALYGKFLNAELQNPDRTAEMFLDLTPGTPRIYRRELMEKLFGIGYDTARNLLFGTDCSAEDYNVDWVTAWRTLDDSLYDALGVPDGTRQGIYHDNLMRFLGLADRDYRHTCPVSGVTL